MKKLFQVVAKWHYTNLIAIYDFRDINEFTNAVEILKKSRGVTLITTNIAFV